MVRLRTIAMIADLMTKADFVEATKVDYNIRWRSMRAIGNAVETAHEAIAIDDNQYDAVANIVKKSAGTLRVDRGRITHITMASGHYAPGRVQPLARTSSRSTSIVRWTF